MVEANIDSKPFQFPTPLGGSAELSRDQYRRLVEDGEVSPRRLSTISSAALILKYLKEDSPRKLIEVVGSIHGEANAVPSSTERRATVALVRAKLISMVGAGAAVRYVLSSRR